MSSLLLSTQLATGRPTCTVQAAIKWAHGLYARLTSIGMDLWGNSTMDGANYSGAGIWLICLLFVSTSWFHIVVQAC